MTQKEINAALANLANTDIKQSDRIPYLIDVLVGARDGESSCQEVVSQLFTKLEASMVPESLDKREQELKQFIKQLESAPLRQATFVELNNLTGLSINHALVILENGEMAHILVHDSKVAMGLKLGDKVMVDAHMKVLVHPSLSTQHFGLEARFERKLDDKHIEVISRGDERSIALCSPEILEGIQSGKVKPGSQVVLGGNGKLAIYAVPEPEGLHYFRFLDRGPIPDVITERDIGSPPRVIGDVLLHVREEMCRPELRRKYKLPPCTTKLLWGPSGTGKSLTIAAIHHGIYALISQITGVEMGKLPPRVFRFKPSQLFSMWFGESDKNMDRVFDEVEQMSDQTLEVKDKSYRLPVMVVIEEADGLGRSRGSQGNDVYDRVMTTLLQRLDPNRSGLANKFVIFLSTTNEPHIVDPAFLRRVGGSIEVFGRLDQESFTCVLQKHVAGLPARNGGENRTEKIWTEITRELVQWLFTDREGIVELQLSGFRETVRKHTRDFLTGALVDRAVRQASTQAWEMAIGGDKEAGITADHLKDSLQHQVLGIVNQLTPQNIHQYLDLPEGARVTGMRKVTK